MINKLDLLNPKVKVLAEKLIALCKAKGITIAITQTLRTAEYQNALYAQGRTTPGKIVTNARAGQSSHESGRAFDFVLITNGKTDWDSRNKNWRVVGEIGEKLGLEWGGRWKFVDLPHFQLLEGKTIAQCIKEFNQSKILV